MAISGRCSPSVGHVLLTNFVMSILVLIDSSSFCLAHTTSFRSVPWDTNNGASSTPPQPIKLEETKDQVLLDNGILQVIISVPGGHVLEIKFHGIDNVLDSTNKIGDRGYWNVFANDFMDILSGTQYKVIKKEDSVVEISFSKTWNAGDAASKDCAPVNADKRYIMLQGKCGFYTYAILERLAGWPDVGFEEFRTVYKPNGTKFEFMAVGDEIQRMMPSAEDRAAGEALAYPEAVLLTNPTNPKFKGEVDDKYQYAQSASTKVHGWICNDPSVGFWMIIPSDEFRDGGPTKYELTSHTGPIMLSMFASRHFSGDSGMNFQNGEPWKKVFGPVFLYLNSAPPGSLPQILWDDAKRQKDEEVKSWPYNFVTSEDYPHADQRGGIDGQLFVNDRYVNKELIPGSSANVGLAAPGEVGSWQLQSKGYQFWTQADTEGRFSIANVRPGDYVLYAWVPGFVGEYKHNLTITIRPGEIIKLPNIEFSPPRNGPTLWEIGVPDRSAAEFFVPDPSPNLVNPLFLDKPLDKYRQYGLWTRYAELFPESDVVFKVGVSNYTKDWFFAHVNRQIGEKNFTSTIWQIVFDLPNVRANSNYTLQLAFASAQAADMHVRINEPSLQKTASFSTGSTGKDNAIARHGIHGVYWFFTVNVESSKLVNGSNTIYLRQSRSLSAFEGFMYDYIRLEGPPDV